MAFESIINRGEFFSNHYLDAVIGGDLGDLRGRWDERERRDMPTARTRVRTLGSGFFRARGRAAEASGLDRAAGVRPLNEVVLEAFGFPAERTTVEFERTGVETLTVPVTHQVETGTGLLLVVIEAGFATDVDQIFDDEFGNPAHLLESLWRETLSFPEPAAAVGEIFAVDEPPRFVMVVAGTLLLLAERAKWADGRFLAVDLDGALERADTSAKGELETIAAVFSADGLVPEDGQSLIDDLVDKSHKHAVGVSQELRNGIRESIEILANEVIQQRLAGGLDVYQGDERINPNELTRQCLRWLYRLLVLLYAESRPELGVLPVDDDAYLAGYSLDRLRELVLVDLETDQAREGSHLHESLNTLFELANEGNHQAIQGVLFSGVDADLERSEEVYLQFPGLNAGLFDTVSTRLLDTVSLRNEPLQRVLKNLMLAEGRTARDTAGFISYAQLGINQLGAVYEGLMAYTGFFADQDLFEVAKGGDPSDGTWVLPVDDAEGYPDEVFVTYTDPTTGRKERIRHATGSFVFRLSGRDRQRSASFYTPEVLTRCVVKHALAELLGLDDYAPKNGSSGITEAVDLLDLTICEPALGSGAFANEAINQLSAEYLRRRQAEKGESLDPETYLRELQKTKAHFGLHQTYGVDLNATAVELAEVSLWLNAMHPGLKAPWFGLQLRRGNSLIGCRRATWRTTQLRDQPWANTTKDQTQPPVDRSLADGPLETDEFHHFLVPGHGWAAVAERKEAKELRPEETERLKAWKKNILKAPKASDAERLTGLAAAVEDHWQRASGLIRLTQQELRRPIDIYGATIADTEPTISRQEAERILEDPDSPIGRLRTLMDAWTGLWFWPLDTGMNPPSWNEWLTVSEILLNTDADHLPTGQLGFDDLTALLKQEDDKPVGPSVNDLTNTHPWLNIAVQAARTEAAWHWELEYAPVFQQGGFDLQVGNPPWVRPVWKDDLVLAEIDPWWAITTRPPVPEQEARRATNLTNPTNQAPYLKELASAEGLVTTLNSPLLTPTLTGIQTNLYMVFMETVWRHLPRHGIAGLLHPESHFTDPSGGALRAATYSRLKRRAQFSNLLALFPEAGVTGGNTFALNIYGWPLDQPSFTQVGNLLHPDTYDGSLIHDQTGPVPSVQYPKGGWDLRPHRDRIVNIDLDVLDDWAHLFDEPGTPPNEARLLRPVSRHDLQAISTLAAQPLRLADHRYSWSAGWHEKAAKTDGTIHWETTVPGSWEEVILQGPSFSVATPYAKQPNEDCQNNQDYSDWDLESLPDHVIPRTNYQRGCERVRYTEALSQWEGQPYTDYWRLAWRAMTQPGLERSFHASLLPPGPSHVGSAFSLTLATESDLCRLAGLWASLPFDYLVKVSGTANVKEFIVKRLPFPAAGPLDAPLVLRTLRLSCLTIEYSPLWEQLFDPAWQQDRWTDPDFDRTPLGELAPTWQTAIPLRRDFERRLALVEIDALAALAVGLNSEQLCGLYRAQFATFRKYESSMVFDSEGRKICGFHQSAGFRQSQLQDQAKAGELPDEWKRIWALYEQYEEDPDSVDWLGHYTPPFTRADREAEMTRAYDEFARRLADGEYES